jgi:hypothetical protein
MPIKRILFIVLIVGGVGIYAWDFFLIAKNVSPAGSSSSATIVAPEAVDESLLLRSGRSVKFTPLGKSPLSAYKETPKPVASAQPKVASTTPKPATNQNTDIKPPSITINGIMWNPQNPVVMIGLSDGSSTVAKVGSVVDGFQVKKIERTQILVVSQGKEYWLK